MNNPESVIVPNDGSRSVTQSPLYFRTYFEKQRSFSIISDYYCFNISTDFYADSLALNHWLNPRVAHFNSISHASKILLNEQKNWILIPHRFHRKAALIQAKLPLVPQKKLKFLSQPPRTPLGHWLLLNENTLLFSSACSARTPHGIYNFEEDKTGPPSRAYLKLWELFTKLGVVPDSQSTCIDLGSSPGGWTWVLSHLTKLVFSIDKSDLKLRSLPNVKYVKDDILKDNWISLIPEAQWIFCDAALSPDKLVPTFLKIMEEYPELNFICTLKQKGDDITPLTKKISKLQGTSLLALSSNKHELTWVKIKNNVRFLD